MLFEAVLCLALNIYFEARDQSVEGRVAVTQVVMNRVLHPDYPDNPCDVVYQSEVYPSGHPVKYRCQFSWFCDGKSDEPVDYQAFHDALVIVDFWYSTALMISLKELRTITQSMSRQSGQRGNRGPCKSGIIFSTNKFFIPKKTVDTLSQCC